MRRLRMGMIGGGPGAFIGPIHRIAAEMDREIELVAGAFSSDAARSKAGGRGIASGEQTYGRQNPDFVHLPASSRTRIAPIQRWSSSIQSSLALPLVPCARPKPWPPLASKWNSSGAPAVR